MNIINGKVYPGDAIIVNGWVIRGASCDDSTSKKFDETKKESTNNVNRIIIDSDVNVKVFASNTSEVIAHLYGSAIMNGELNLSVTKVGDEIHISVKLDGSALISNSILGSSVIINNFISGSNRVKLDIQIPARVFETLYVKSKNDNIDVASSVNANTIKVCNANGKIDVFATFQTLKIESKNGKVNVDSEACCDIRLGIMSKNGKVNVSLGNIGTSKVVVDSKNGSCKNNPRLRGSYTAFGYITSKNGNIRLQ